MNRIDGTTDGEVMFGTSLSDWIYSYTGPDAVHGAYGKDIYTPGADGDLKYFADFEDGSDLIDLREWGISSLDQLVITTSEDGKVRIETVDGSKYLFINSMDRGAPMTIDAKDLILVGTALHEYSTGFDNVFVTANESAVHFGNGGTNWLNLGRLVKGSETATAGIVAIMDNDELGNGSFTVKGVTQHFFDFQNIRGSNGRDSLVGDQQDNNLVGLGNADIIRGGDGDDRVFGNVGADNLYGDAGDDVLNGGDGYDKIWGGAGADSFVMVAFDTRRDLIFDYEDGTDKLDIQQWDAESIDDLTIVDRGVAGLRVTLTGTDLSFDLRGGGESLIAADLDNSDFIFG